MKMHYIELPANVKIRRNETNYHGFTWNDTWYSLEDILKKAEQGRFIDSNLSISVSTRMPEDDKPYAEYLPGVQGKPSQWCEVVNGKIKTSENYALNALKPWIDGDEYRVLSETRKSEVMEARKEQKQDRYEKGPKSY